MSALTEFHMALVVLPRCSPSDFLEGNFPFLKLSVIVSETSEDRNNRTYSQ